MAGGTMTCTVSPAKMLGVAAGGLCLSGIGYVLAVHPINRPAWIGWLILAFFVPVTIVVLIRLVRGVTVTLDEAGIGDSRWSLGTVPWEAIRSISIVSVMGTRLLGLDLADEERYFPRLSPLERRTVALNQATGLPALSVSFVGLSPGIAQAWEYINKNHPELTTDRP